MYDTTVYTHTINTGKTYVEHTDGKLTRVKI